jgi:hypothetical protein
MHLIDPDQLPEKERPDLATINNGLLTIERLRKPQTDPLDEPYRRLNIAWNHLLQTTAALIAAALLASSIESQKSNSSVFHAWTPETENPAGAYRVRP